MEIQTMEKNRLQRLPASVASTIKPVLTTIKKQKNQDTVIKIKPN